MKNTSISLRLLLLLVAPVAICTWGCDKSSFQMETAAQLNNGHRLEIGLQELIENAEITATITQRSHGYIAEARGRGVIPSGEYAGQRFQIAMEGEYSDVGTETLISGSAEVTIRGDRYTSIIDPTLQSFCCGEGHLYNVDGEFIFTMFGRVAHDGHQHLFAGLASTAKTMNMNIADQTGTVVEPATPPHDPGIGLIEEFSAQFVRVALH